MYQYDQERYSEVHQDQSTDGSLRIQGSWCISEWEHRSIIWLLLFAISFLNALLDTHPHCFNKDEEYHVINKYLPKRSVTECPDFEETIDACCNKCEQHYGQRSWKQIFHFLIESKATAHAIPGTNIVKSLCSVKPGCSYPSLSEVGLRCIST